MFERRTEGDRPPGVGPFHAHQGAGFDRSHATQAIGAAVAFFAVFSLVAGADVGAETGVIPFLFPA
ncbi:hypothetical protein D9M71_570680 [compost metagenome]